MIGIPHLAATALYATMPASISVNAVAVLIVPISCPMQSLATRLTSSAMACRWSDPSLAEHHHRFALIVNHDKLSAVRLCAVFGAHDF
jgi:hypothetical protein